MNTLSIQNNNNNNDCFFDSINKLYDLFTTEIFPTEVLIPKGFEELIKLLYKRHNQKQPKINTYLLQTNKLNENTNKNVILGYSGGMDSSYLALYLKNNGYDVTLFHLKGLNKCYPKEDEFAKIFAKQNNFKYIEKVIKHNNKEFFIDNPIKNQLILSLMLDYGIKNNIFNFALGDDLCTNIEDAKIGMTITDSKEVNELFWIGVQNYFKNANLITIDKNVRKIDRIKYIIKNESLDYIYSCISPHRFNNKLHNDNSKKYNVKILDGRCGSCYKCCMEILLLSELNYIYDKEKNKDLIKHCWKILSDSKNSHGKEKFNKKLPLEIRLKNLIEY